MIPSFKDWISYNVAEHGLHTKSFKILGISENSYHEIRDWNLFVPGYKHNWSWLWSQASKQDRRKKKNEKKTKKGERKYKVSVVGRIRRVKYYSSSSY